MSQTVAFQSYMRHVTALTSIQNILWNIHKQKIMHLDYIMQKKRTIQTHKPILSHLSGNFKTYSYERKIQRHLTMMMV